MDGGNKHCRRLGGGQMRGKKSIQLAALSKGQKLAHAGQLYARQLRSVDVMRSR